jgi:hypothetical protein
MRETRTPADRFHDILERGLAPALASLGFRRRRALLECDRGEVRSLIELELAPWTNPEKICFTLAWGVIVPDLDVVLGDGAGSASRADECPVHGRLGESRSRFAAMWFTVGPTPVPGAHRLVDAHTTRALLRSTELDVLPSLARLETIGDVQAELVEGLVRGRGAADDDELRRIRTIAGLSLLLGERDNASRWLDYLEARSSVAIAPDVVAERLAALRQRCAS